MNRYSTLMLGLSLLLLVAAPWVYLSAQWTVYAMGISALITAVMFRLSDD